MSGYLGAVARDQGEDAVLAKITHQRALDELRSILAYRRVVELRDLSDREWDPIATELNKSSATVRREYGQAMRLIHAHLRAAGIDARQTLGQ